MFETKRDAHHPQSHGVEPHAFDHPSVNGSNQHKPLRQLVPIRSLGENHRARITSHLLALDSHDRYLRFGFSAQDRQIESYAQQLNFERDEIFGIFNRGLELVAVAHLAVSDTTEYSHCAEFGVSVAAKVRGRGFGARLFERAALNATNAGISSMFIHALSDNAAMLRIAQKAGARVQRDGTETEAYLTLPAAGLDTQLAELVAEHAAQIDYKIKSQAKQFWEFLENLQAKRAELREGRPTELN